MQVGLWEMVCGLIGSQAFVEAVRQWLNRKSNRVIADAAADKAKFEVLQDMEVFLQQQLKEKEERFADQTMRLRGIQDELFGEREKRHRAELELASVRCEDMYCPFRQPPNAHTPPPSGQTKEEYHRPSGDGVRPAVAQKSA